MARDRMLLVGLMALASLLSWGFVWLVRQSAPAPEESSGSEMVPDALPLAVPLYLTGLALAVWLMAAPFIRRIQQGRVRVQGVPGGVGILWLGHLAGTLLVYLLLPHAFLAWGHALCLPGNVLQIPLPLFTLCLMGLLYFLPGLVAGGAAGWLFHYRLSRIEA